MPTYTPEATTKLQQLLTHYIAGEPTILMTPFTVLKDRICALLNQGADPAIMPTGINKISLLHLLIYHYQNGNNYELMGMILEQDKKLVHVENSNNATPLQYLINRFYCLYCTSDDFKNMAMLLVQYRPDITVQHIDSANNTILHLLNPLYSSPEIATVLNLNPNLVNIKNLAGRTPLHTFIRSNPDAPVNAILQLVSARNLKEKDANEETLLHAASISGNLAIARHLKNNGLSLLDVTKEKNTMLHCAVGHKDLVFWEWLLENKVDINARNSEGQTALHLVCEKINPWMLEWLMRNGAKLSIKNNKGETPLQIAIKGNLKATAMTLFKAENPLLTSIVQFHQYGVALSRQGALKEGQVAVTLAAELKIMADDFFKNNETLKGFDQFKEKFWLKLNSKNKEMMAYRTDWSTILKNVAVALTGIGALVILCNLLYTKVNGNNPLFLFQKSKTTRHEKLVDVVDSLEDMGRMDRLGL